MFVKREIRVQSNADCTTIKINCQIQQKISLFSPCLKVEHLPPSTSLWLKHRLTGRAILGLHHVSLKCTAVYHPHSSKVVVLNWSCYVGKHLLPAALLQNRNHTTKVLSRLQCTLPYLRLKLHPHFTTTFTPTPFILPSTVLSGCRHYSVCQRLNMGSPAPRKLLIAKKWVSTASYFWLTGFILSLHLEMQ